MSDLIENLTKSLPARESARRFYAQLKEKHPSETRKLEKNEGLLSDVLTLAAFSPFLAATVLQHPEYIAWLNRQRISTKPRGKAEILESLARFALTNSQLETNVLLARFRRRELLRVYLRDIRNLGTIAEITEEISSLADTILEYALRQARQQLDNRYGIPLEIDEKNRARQAEFCIVALGKLGSKELNYASDIDLVFLYSSDGFTSGQGARGAVTNREYFIKLAEVIVKLVGAQTGEGAAYRVDVRLRPHGRVGSLAISLAEAINYYRMQARAWERQVLIRSRSSAGDAGLFRQFFEKVETNVFSKDETVEEALRNVRLSKEKINFEKPETRGFNVKLGRGGIREIEFVAQALQLAFGGKDAWLRVPHTLISLSRLADRELLSETELNELAEAYAFLRRLEHRLQMENGLQTHLIPENTEKRLLVAERMNCRNLSEFNKNLKTHSNNVNRIFTRVFGENEIPNLEETGSAPDSEFQSPKTENRKSKTDIKPILSSLEKSDLEIEIAPEILDILETLSEISPHFAEMLTANPALIENLPRPEGDFDEKNYRAILLSAIENSNNLAQDLAALRKTWSPLLLEIIVFDVFEKISRFRAKELQTALAEASLEAAILIVKKELARRFGELRIKNYELRFAVLGLGKLGGGGMDYGSDLDLVLIHDDEETVPVENLTHAEFYSRVAEIFVTALSAMTREGSLYRVDLRLRPDGKNGATTIGKTAFLNYLETRAAIWEWLAYVKLRGTAGDANLTEFTEEKAREIIHRNALQTEAEKLKNETRRVRERLEKEKSGTRTGKEINIKFGEGGLLDIYFAMRFLQLRDNVPDEKQNRATAFMLEKLYEKGSLDEQNFQNFSDGYDFLSQLDHNLRLTVGRSTRLPLANQKALQIIAERMKIGSVNELLEELTAHRLGIRSSFDNVLKA